MVDHRHGVGIAHVSRELDALPRQVTDPEATSVSVQVQYKRPPVRKETIAMSSRSHQLIGGRWSRAVRDSGM